METVYEKLEAYLIEIGKLNSWTIGYEYEIWNVIHSLFSLFVITYLQYFYISNLFYVNGFDFPSTRYYSIILHAILYFKLYGLSLSLTSSLYVRPWRRKVVPSEITAKYWQKYIYIILGYNALMLLGLLAVDK